MGDMSDAFAMTSASEQTINKVQSLKSKNFEMNHITPWFSEQLVYKIITVRG